MTMKRSFKKITVFWGGGAIVESDRIILLGICGPYGIVRRRSLLFSPPIGSWERITAPSSDEPRKKDRAHLCL